MSEMDMKWNKRNPTLKELYQLGLPTISFSNLSTKYSLNHCKVQDWHIKPFATLEEYHPEAVLEGPFMHSSSIFMYLNMPCSTMQFHVRSLMDDIVKLIEQQGRVPILSNYSIVEPAGAVVLPELLAAYMNQKPIFPILVLRPKDGTVADDPGDILGDAGVLGQAYNCIKNLQEFHGVGDIFAIVTTMKHWKLVWLPSTDAIATATTIPAASSPQNHDVQCRDDSQASAATSGEQVVDVPRVVSVSQTYAHDTVELPRVLMSATKKTLSTTFREVSTVSLNRQYFKLNSSSWQWVRLSAACAAELKEKVTQAFHSPPAVTDEYLILTYLSHMSNFKAWLCMALNSPHVGVLCVIKQCKSEALALQEADYWHAVNDTPQVAIRRVCGRHSVVMPVVVLTEEKEGDEDEDEGNRVSFQFDPRKWLVQDGVTATEVPEGVVAVAAAMKTLAEPTGVLSPRAAAEQAIARMAALGRCHEDLEWRHVALIPLFGSNGQLVDVRPGLIDFGSVRGQVAPDTALTTMMARLDEMSFEMSFE